MTLRELVFNVRGRGPFPDHTAFVVSDATLVERTRAIHLFEDSVWEMNHATGPQASLDRLRSAIRSPGDAEIVAREIVHDGPGGITYFVRRVRPADPASASVEHLVHDALGGGALIRRRIVRGRVEYAIGGDSADGMRRLHARVLALDERDGLMVDVLRVGDYRPEAARVSGFPRMLTLEDEELLRAALESGYYDNPKRCGVRELGEHLGFSKTVVARKLRAIERRALESVLAAPATRPE